MVSLTAASYCFFASPYSHLDLNTFPSPSWDFVFNSNPRRGTRKQEPVVSLSLVAAAKERENAGSFSGFLEVEKRNYRGYCNMCVGFVRRCKKDLDSEGDLALEAEILEFMRNSENPNAFPTKKQFMDAGRLDLVEAIARQGGWLAFGWDLDDDDKEEQQQQQQKLEGFQENGVNDWDLTVVKGYKNGALQESFESGEKSSALDCNEVRKYGVSSFPVNSSCSASSSGRSLEQAIEDDSGIEGILNRLEKERNTNFGFGLREKGNTACVQSDGRKDDRHVETSKEETVAGLGRSNKLASLDPGGGIINNSGGKLTQNTSPSNQKSPKPEMWRTWSIQRAGFSDKEFEAAEIASNEGAMDVSGDEILEVRDIGCEHLNRPEKLNSYPTENNHNDIRSRLQQLELELSSVLHTLRSNSGELLSQKGFEGLSDDLHKLSDAWEFQENEIMNAKDRLRSIRAKLAVLEGKMALTIIDAQKMVEEKQKRIDDARRTLMLIRTVCVVWPNLASEVLLAGSFDGWASQRKMEKSSAGIFSLSLKLYPGRYEIKFIVDGEWKIDPLRPIVYNNGYENNLLVVT